jgi:endonuclease/exonuclease/phosphatase family metal-dependent hydrolase
MRTPEMLDTETTRSLSDHLPVIYHIDTALLRESAEQ